MTRLPEQSGRLARRSPLTRTMLRIAGGTAILVALTIGAEGCSNTEAAEVARTPVVTLVSEDLATVERRDLSTGAIIAGTLTARRRATVRAEVGGAVTAIYADRGTEVASGAPLLRIEGRAIREAQTAAAFDLRTDEDALALAKRRLTRAEALLAGGAIASDEVDDARQAVTSAESRVAASRARLSAAVDAFARTIVRAPFAGIVSTRPVNVGDIIETGNVLFEVLDPTTMYVESSVPAVHLGAVHVGTPVQFTVTGYPNRTFEGRIERVNPAADPATRQVPVFIAIRNGDGALVAGLFAEGRVAPTAGPALLVPGAAVERNGSSASVVRFADGRIERRTVEIGRQDADGALVEIRSGLTLGDTVVLGVSRSVPSGSAA
ncbi:MAG TPA: efflux RND transporter periplasmic adaptor subunit, partial [Gemmatimonadaceae bacterium]|nr:efflux RND transporter periplasmic adaptor subunit [Gemmatimonadaceae bacterium]